MHEHGSEQNSSSCKGCRLVGYSRVAEAVPELRQVLDDHAAAVVPLLLEPPLLGLCCAARRW